LKQKCLIKLTFNNNFIAYIILWSVFHTPTQWYQVSWE